MGLVRAFLQAGARTVVATLWPLRDDEAAAFFGRFYEHVAQGATVDEAVAAAQADQRERGVPAEGWAGVVVVGDGSARPALEPRTHLGWAVGTLAGLRAGISVWIRRRREGSRRRLR